MAADNLYGHLKMIYFHHPCIIQDIWFNFIIVIVHIELWYYFYDKIHTKRS